MIPISSPSLTLVSDRDDGGIFDPQKLPLTADSIAEYQHRLREGTLEPEQFREIFRLVRNSWPSEFQALCRVDALFDKLMDFEKPRSTSIARPDMHGYVPVPLLLLMRALEENPLGPDDVLCDIGSGLSRVPIFTRLWTGRPAIGIDIQTHLLEIARAALKKQNVGDVDLVCGDARNVPLPAANIFFMYQPFGGPIMDAVLGRLKELSTFRPITLWWIGFQQQWMGASTSWLQWSTSRRSKGQEILIGKSF